MKPDHSRFGIGPAEELSQRVSVAALVSVMFTNPENGKTMLALERTATMHKDEVKSEVIVKAKPFGGGARLKNPDALKKVIGNFHYDSERSYQERDFRILINPKHWEKIKEICKAHMEKIGNGILDPGPERELEEEFEDSLGIMVTPNDYYLKPNGMIVENLPNETENVNAKGLPTVRIYYIYEAIINSSEIIKLILINGRQYSDKDLQKMAWEDVRQGGKGRANAILAVDLDDLKEIYRSISIDELSGLIRFKEHQLDGNVLAVLDEIDHPKYQRFI